jgi:competence ComEA-like helix-hairpin-helix protein
MTRLTALTGMVAVLTVILAASWCSTIAQNTPNKADIETLPSGPGKEVVIQKCLPCHNVRVTTAKRGSGSTEEWEQVIDKMVSQGAELSDDEIDLVVQYLSTYYGPNSKNTKPTSSGKQAEPRPDASGTQAPPLLSNPSSPVPVNKASVDELEAALGLSRAEADTIVRYREQHGNFKSWQDVSSVPGVPPEKIKANQKRLVF